MKFADQGLTLLLGAALGGWFFLSIFNTEVLDPRQIGWLMRDDWRWHFMGWHFFRHEPWQFPLGKITHYFYPVGTSIGLTDSIPLFALIFKLFDPWLPADFQYLGLWLLLSFVLQGVFAALLMRLITPNRLVQIIGILLFIMSPILLHRIGHVALSAHWLLLAGLWLYFKSWEQSSPFPRWLLLVSVSAAIHPYLTVMVFGLTLAFYGRWWLVDRRTTLISVAGQLSVLIVATVIIEWQMGYFLVQDKSQLAIGGWGVYSMNLLAPINPLGWSRFLKDLPTVGDGQYEGFNYFGLGALLLGAWALYEWQRRPPTWRTVRTIVPLASVCLGFTLLAISSKVTIGSWVVLDIMSQPPAIFQAFRGSGRFFWLPYYGLLFLTIKLLSVRNPQRSLFIIGLGLVVQTVDLSDIYRQHQQRQTDVAWQTWDNPLQSHFWTLMSRYYQHITFIAPITCEEEAAPRLPFSYVAGRYGMTINTGHASRYDATKAGEYCQQLLKNRQQGVVADNTVYIVHPRHLEAFQKVAQQPLTCAKIDGFNTCVTARSHAQWQSIYKIN